MIQGFLMVVAIIVAFVAGVACACHEISTPRKMGSFTVLGYKNGELIYKQTITDRTYTVGPGDTFDKLEILK